MFNSKPNLLGFSSQLQSHMPANMASYHQLFKLNLFLSSLMLFLSVPEKCLQGNGGCSHQCAVIPSKGVVCSCPTGLHLGSDNRTCETVDYCSAHLKCSQICEQHKTTVKCSCYPGWSLDPDGESCHSTGI